MAVYKVTGTWMPSNSGASGSGTSGSGSKHSTSRNFTFNPDKLLSEVRRDEIEEAQRRSAARAADAARRRKVQGLFRKLDTDKDGYLHMDEVRELLAAMANGHTPSEEEMAFMEQVAGWQPPFNTFNLGDLADAINYWWQYLDAFQTPASWGSEAFAKYDKDGSGTIEAAELQGLLTELNGNVFVPEAEVAWVMKKADILGQGSLTRIALTQAVSIWFQRTARHKHHDKKHKHKGEGESAETAKPSRMCVLQ